MNDSHMNEWCVLVYCSHTPPTVLFVSPLLQSKHDVNPTYLPLSITPHHPSPSKSIQQTTGKKIEFGLFLRFLVACCLQTRALAAFLTGEGGEGAERIKNPFCVSGVLATHFSMRWFSSIQSRSWVYCDFLPLDNV